MHRIALVIDQYKGSSMKHWKIVLSALVIAFAVNASFAGAIKVGAPPGWQLWGPEGDKYEIGIDMAEGTPEHPVLIIASKTEPTKQSLAITQDIDATDWQGKLIEFSLMARAVGAEKNKIWLRYMRKPGMLWMEEKRIPAGRGWERIVVKSYFPKDVDTHYNNHFEIGIALGSPGKIWIRDVKLEKMELPPLDENRMDIHGFRSGLPASLPRNLNFTD